ncbi:MAG: thiamine ABC transporter substrate binding subunit [Nocardioides sp.]|uniref:thiamine ABC transporter substrate-binding protein n=1 Tax=Nocardioides sp. TaxID=35761 RepID=UPI003F09E727
MNRLCHATALVVSTALLSGCSAIGGSSEDGTGDGPAPTEVVLVTHNSFNLPEELVAQFEADSGFQLVVNAAGDGGTLASKLALTAGNPTGDVAFGVDNTFSSRPLDAGVFAPFSPELPNGAEAYALEEGADRLTPVDVGNVCLNVDTDWFADHDVAPPGTLDDLTKPAYKGLTVVPGASTSTPGMAFLLATIAEYGDDWPQYWSDLLANDLRVVDGWEDAYYGDFTAGGDKGERPVVLSYDSSPAFTVKGKGDKARSSTAALLDTCFQQVEYAGVLEGAKNPEGAEALVQWLVSDEVQAALPESMYVFPVSSAVELPEDWARFAERASDPYEVSPAEIAEHREEWLTEWTDVISR